MENYQNGFYFLKIKIESKIIYLITIFGRKWTCSSLAFDGIDFITL